MIGLFVPRNLNLLYRVIALPSDARMRFEEFAATFEYEQGWKREDAEAHALTVIGLTGPAFDYAGTIDGRCLRDVLLF